MSFCSKPTNTKRTAAARALKTASAFAPNRPTSAGTKIDEAISPNGVIAAERPISPGDMPCRCIMKVNSG